LGLLLEEVFAGRLGGLQLQRQMHALMAACGSRRPQTRCAPRRTPVLLCLRLHGRRVRVFALYPMRLAARTIVRILALRDNPFEAKLASVPEDRRAVLLDMLIESNAWRRTAKQHVKSCSAHFER